MPTERETSGHLYLQNGPVPIEYEYHQVTDLSELQPGDTIAHVGGGLPYMVTRNYGDHVTAVRTVDVSNPPEWKVLRTK